MFSSLGARDLGSIVDISFSSEEEEPCDSRVEVGLAVSTALKVGSFTADKV